MIMIGINIMGYLTCIFIYQTVSAIDAFYCAYRSKLLNFFSYEYFLFFIKTMFNWTCHRLTSLYFTRM